MMPISICIPTYNRTKLLYQSFEQVYDDDRVSEIVIVDDASDDDVFEEVRAFCGDLKKVQLHRNPQNKDCYENKYTSVFFSTNEWCILLDSDNVIDKSYLDAIYSLDKWEDDIAYMPSFAKPTFDYRHFSGRMIDRTNVAGFMGQHMFDVMLNCMNYFVNTQSYIKTWQPVSNPHTADSILQNYNWFASGRKMLVVPGLSYYHRIHDGSHYKNNVHKTGNLYNEIVEKLKALK